MNKTYKMRSTLIIAGLITLFATTSCHKSDDIIPSSLIDDKGGNQHDANDDKGGDNKNKEDDNPSENEDNGGK